MIGNEICFHFTDARVAELVDALDLGSSSGDRMGVRVSPLAPFAEPVGKILPELPVSLVINGKEEHESNCGRCKQR